MLRQLSQMLAATPSAVQACSDGKLDYNPLSQPCASDFGKAGFWAPDNAISRLEHIRPGMYAGIKGGYDSYWKIPNYGNP